MRLFFLILFFSINIFSQDTKISGKVFDKYTGKPIEFANVSIVEKGLGATTDSTGFFLIN